MAKGKEKIYCSLDIETSGFDPLTNEILEVGFAIFKAEDLGFKIIEEYTQVFRPSKPVSPQIFGLTGITQAELDKAPSFADSHKFLQDKLGQAVIVGHNIAFDTKFLASFGIKFSGETIDTLDLAQFILPTHHSYNLENLMHTFGISHKEAHRALADSKATLRLLEKLLQVYNGFPKELKGKIQKLAGKQEFLWRSFLDTEFEPLSFAGLTQQEHQTKLPVTIKGSLKLQPNTVYNFSLDENYLDTLIALKQKEKVLLVVPKAQTALELYKNSGADAAVFLPEQQFDKIKLAALLKKKNLSADEIKFLLKLLVWQYTNWQTETLLDLNLSFFGGQFKSLVSGGKVKENKKAKVITCSHEAFLYLSDNGIYKDCHVVICGLSEFESAVTSNIGSKAGWGYINYLLKSFYNPELNTGQQKFKDEVQAGLLASDLFFGLVNALLQTDPPTFQYYKISPEVEYDQKYQKIKTAAESFTDKLLNLNKALGSKEITGFLESLKNFFKPESNRVKWVELSENRCVFLNMPLDITGLVKNTLKVFSSASFADSLDDNVLPQFFIRRLGLENFKIAQAAEFKAQETNKAQGDLFSSIKKVFSGKAHNINYHFLPKAADAKLLMEIVNDNKSLPGAVLFGSQAQVREFYEQNYRELKEQAYLLAQSSSGGSNKIFRNFSINNNSLLLATDKFILKHISGQNAVEPVTNLPVKTLILCRLPFEQFTHPYQEALSKALPNAFEGYSLPRALYNFQNIIKFFYSPLLTDIFIIDSKLNNSYAKVFKDYWQNIPKAQLKI